MKKLIFFSMTSFLLVGCSYSISMVHTEGTAEDVIDDTKTNTTEVSPSLSVPAVV